MSVADDTISDGWLCDRGRYNIGFYESPERLMQPLYRKGGSFVQIGWDDVFILWSKAIREAMAARGPQAVGAIGGGRLTNEEAFALQHVFRSIGINNLDWRAGVQRQATPGRNDGPLSAIDGAQVISMLGASPAERAPVLWLRVMKAVRNGARVLQINSGSELRDGIGDARRVALVWDGADLELGKNCAREVGGVAELSTFIASEQSNARGAEAMGMLPRSGPGYVGVVEGLDSYAMFERARAGDLAVLSLFGTNPARNGIDPSAIGAALDKIPFLVVSELFMTETASHATLVLPARGAFEKDGTTTSLAGDLLPVNASLQAPDSTCSDFEMIAELAGQLGVAMPSFEELDRTVINHIAKARNDFTFGDDMFASVVPSASTPLNAGSTRILSGGGTWAHDPWLAGLREEVS
jgi:NADH-quinone oxidoreductase subunit G